MNAHDILDMIGNVKGTYVWDSQQARSGSINSSGKKLFSNGNAVLVDYLRYDTDRNPNNPWLRSSDNSGQDHSMVEISESEFKSVLRKYEPVNLSMQPVSQYPFK